MKAIEQNIEKEIAQAVMEEQPMQPPAPKRKKRLTESTAAKVIAFLLMLVMTAVTAGGVLGAVFLYSTDVYVTSETAFKQSMFESIAWDDGFNLLYVIGPKGGWRRPRWDAPTGTSSMRHFRTTGQGRRSGIRVILPIMALGVLHLPTTTHSLTRELKVRRYWMSRMPRK